jgi:hypothetical protein
MAEETFEGFVARERQRLRGGREVIFTAQHELEYTPQAFQLK